MSEQIDLATAATRVRVLATMLSLGGRLDLWSMVLAAIALASLLGLALPIASDIGLLLSFLAGGAQKILAMRVALDEALFRHWAESWRRRAFRDSESISMDEDLAMLDKALDACGLRESSDGVLRTLEHRMRGAGNLLKLQVFVFAFQFTALMLAALVVIHFF